MSFWCFCEKVSGFVGQDVTLAYIQVVHRKWLQNKTVGEAADAIRTLEGKKSCPTQ